MMFLPLMVEFSGAYEKPLLGRDGHRRVLKTISEHDLWCTYAGMKLRCHSKRATNLRDYGGRGIKVCQRWLGKGVGFRNFVADMGVRPEGHTLERINNDGDYEPSNCRWANRSDQATNRRSTVFLSFEGETKSLMQWSEHLGISHTAIQQRVSAGMPIEKILAPDDLRNKANRYRRAKAGGHRAI